ncbi:putative NADH-flavin reductase [Asanoa ferruginea]|uniref:Putative NADH-flavin reductase n=1 Tax=Asanoa ferruginea TaxID=53367 RepID=A0A3D9ZPW2_9ACTN|nr:NAD(P)H-binding protein [Asanoa ferruginea]REF99408.1 putative NADH-flavin reductase [Asanoa ferruginea]GIF46012.1 NmrA family transcriptional regulator [Asanoa ferruginea]
MKLVVFGANGATGRLLVREALAAGHLVVAATRHPRDFPLAGGRLVVEGIDVLDKDAVTWAVEGADVVLSTLGVPFTRKPITVYSAGIANIAGAMSRHGIKRLIAVSSSATEPSHHAEGGFLLNRVIQPLVTATIGRTTYADMRRMERFLRDSDLDWTVLRPSGLFDAASVSPYELREDRADGIFTSRIDLAASMLAQATSTEWIRRNVAVTTSVGAPTLVQMLRREAFGRD